MANRNEQKSDKQDVAKNVNRRIVTEGLFLLLFVFILFFSAGRMDWDYAWIFTITTALIALIGAVILPRELLSERGRKKDNVEKWDTQISRLIILF